MIIEQALTTYMKAHAGLSALIGTRFYPAPLPEAATLPAVTYQRISTPRVRSHSGGSGRARPRFQFDCWSEDYLEAHQVANQVRIALEGYVGTMGGAGGVAVRGGFTEDERDDFEPVPQRYRVMIDVILQHQEATS